MEPSPAAEPRLTSVDLTMAVGAALAIATAAPLAKVADGLSPIGVGAGRCLVATLAILLIAPRATLAAVRGLGGRSLLAMAGAGALLAGHFALFLGGLANTSFPAAVALVSLEPLTVVLAGWTIFGIRPNRFELSGILLAMVGAIVVTGGAGEGDHRIAGDLMVIAAAVLYGVYVMAARGLRDRLPVLPYAASVYGVAGLLLLPFAIGFAAGEAPPPAATWGVIAAMGLVPTLIGHTLIQRLSRRVPPSVVALVSPGETIGSMAIGAVMLRAWPTTHEWIGTALVLAGATLAVTGARTR